MYRKTFMSTTAIQATYKMDNLPHLQRYEKNAIYKQNT